MWASFARIILRNKWTFLIVLILSTGFMAYMGTKIQLSYEFARVLPPDDPAYTDYANFKEKFGEDGSVLVLGFSDKKLFELNTFNQWYDLANDIKAIEGIQEVLSITRIYNVTRNDSLQKFDFDPVIKNKPQTQAELDSLREIIATLPFYEGLAFNSKTDAHIMAITFDKKNLDSKNRIAMVDSIKAKSGRFAEANNIKIHYSGMPYIRSVLMKKVSREMMLFMFLAIVVTTIILWLFFRSVSSVLLSLLVVVIGVIWSLGTLYLLGYYITLLSGLIAPLIIVIGIPNCVFLINKYHEEFIRHGNKVKALSRMVATTGLSLFLANITTAIGFGVFYFTNSSMLVQFGIVAAISVMVTYFVTLIIVPIILSFMAPPSLKFTSHLNAKGITKVLGWIDHLVHNHRKAIYITIGAIVLTSLYGISKVNVVGYVVDDLPKDDPVYTDLKFFEANFNGVLPFEILIDTKEENGVFSNGGEVLYKIHALQKLFKEYPQFSKPLSLAEGVKFFYQGYKDGKPKYYILPPVTELKKLMEYKSTAEGRESKLKGFIDSTQRYTRVSFQMADIGSIKIKRLLKEIQPQVDSVFKGKDYEVTLTGHSLMFLKSNDYLLKNLFESLLIEILLITMVGLALFRSVRIILLSKLPCLIPLVITAGIMGFFNISFKPSTILIFTIAFGIASDGTIYFLTKYRHELKANKRSIPEAVSITIKETGLSMIYTAVILFFGFAIFAASGFGGTQALGILISITLLVSMCTNLILLPAILLSIEKKASKELLEEPLIDIDEEKEEESENHVQSI